MVAPRTEKPKSKAPIIAFAGGGAAVLIAGVAFLALKSASPPEAGPGTRPGDPASVSASGKSPKPDAGHAAQAAPESLVLPDGAVFGGRPLSWWNKGIEEIGGPSDGRYALFERRAKANGLQIAAHPGTKELFVRPSPELHAAVEKRWFPPSGSGEDERPVEKSSTATAADPKVSSLIAELREHFSTHQSFRVSPAHPRVIFAPRRGPTAAIRIQFAAGSYHDRQRPGLTRVAVNALVAASGHEKYEKLASEIDKVGGSLDVETGLTESAIVLSAPAPEFDALAARLIKMCLSPKIASDKVAAAKARSLGRQNDGDLDSLSTALAAHAFNMSALVEAQAGAADALGPLTDVDVRGHVTGPLSPANATVVVAGAFDAERLRAALASAKGGAEVPFERPPGGAAGTYRAVAGIYIQLFAYPATFRNRHEVAAAHLIAALIEEHLFRKLRGAGVAYQVLATPRHLAWFDFILVAVPFGDDPPDKLGELLEKEVLALAKGALTNADIARNRRYVIESFARIDRDPALLAASLATSGSLEWAGPNVADSLLTMNVERLTGIVEPWLQPARAVELDMAPPGATR